MEAITEWVGQRVEGRTWWVKDQAIGGVMQTMGTLAMFVSLVLGSWVLRIMAVRTAAPEPAGISGPADPSDSR